MALTVKATLYPVVGVEDNLTRFGLALNIVRQFQIKLTTVLKAVPAFCQEKVFSTADKERLIGNIESFGIVEVESVPVELAASGADTILVVCVLCCCVATSIGEGKRTFSQTLAIGSSRCINLTCAKYGWHRIGVCTNPLHPTNLTLVAVQLIANLSACHICRRHKGCCQAELAPVVGDIVIGAGTRGTVFVAVGIVSFQVQYF